MDFWGNCRNKSDSKGSGSCGIFLRWKITSIDALLLVSKIKRGVSLGEFSFFAQVINVLLASKMIR